MAMHIGIPDAVYHSSHGVTFHRLMDFIDKGPLYYKRKYIDKSLPDGDEKDWGTLGTAYHIYGLEGEGAFKSRVVSMPPTYKAPASAKKDAPIIDKPWNMNADYCKEWVESQGDKIVLSASDYMAAIAIGQNMRSNSHAARLLKCGWPETTIEQQDERFPVPIKGRLDWIASTSSKLSDAFAIVDPKGTSQLEAFERDALSYKYHRQAAFYRKLVLNEFGKLLPVFLVAVEKSGSHRCRVYQVDSDLLDIATEKNEYDLDCLYLHYRLNNWPIDHDDTLRVISTPDWMKKKERTFFDGIAPWEIQA